jgi:phospholipid/cholesterol/gamma-HCH transport system ATP-binding protein
VSHDEKPFAIEFRNELYFKVRAILRQQRFASRWNLCQDIFIMTLGVASPAIELRSVSLVFESDRVLNKISLQIQKGEIFVVVGPSGQGKSCLLKLMAGIFTPTEGQVLIEGQNFLELSSATRDQLRRKMGMLFQKNALFDSLTGGDNIAFPLVETTALPSDEIDRKVEAFLAAVGLSHAKSLYPSEMSGGMQKRLGIARALALDPEIIFYDDPTAGLDPITSRKIIDLILDLNRKKSSTAVAITNDMNRAFQMATRMGLVVNGELVVTGTPDETRRHSDPRVQQFIHGRLQGPLTESV